MRKNLHNLRQRGFSLIEITLVLAIGLGLLVGGIVFFQQAQASSDLTDKTRAAVGISSEVRNQYRTQADFGGAGDDITETVRTASSIPESQFNGVTITSQGQAFNVSFANLNPKVCARMLTSDLGPNSTVIDGCATGDLTVTYTR